MYYDTHIQFSSQQFGFFHEFVKPIYKPLCLTWWTKLAYQIPYVVFFKGSKLFMLHVTNPIIGNVSMVTKETWAKVTNSMMDQCSPIVVGLIIELEKLPSILAHSKG
jgi:hypothetical protein